MKMLSYINTTLLTMLCVTTICACSALGQAFENSYNVAGPDHQIHIIPSRQQAETMAQDLMPAGNLTFHGGPVMSNVETFAIFWQPAGTTLSPHYRPAQQALLGQYAGHSIGNNNTQYSSDCFPAFIFGQFTCILDQNIQTGAYVYYYVGNLGGLGTSYLDTTPYPSHCNHPLTGSNCITDADIRAEILADLPALTGSGWHGGFDQMIVVYTASGEGSCITNGGACSYTSYCGYHNYFPHGGTEIIYSNEPFTGAPWGDQACQFNPPVPSPNNDAAADAAASVASHELTEAITDPLLTAWWDPTTGQEIGDKCLDWRSAINTFGANTWDQVGGTYLANQMWGGSVFEIQTEWDNHANGGAGGCVQVGP